MLAMRKVIVALISFTFSHAVQLLVASYKPESGVTGAIQTLDLQMNADNASLHVISDNHDCGASPSWLDSSASDRRVTCVDEGAPGSLTVLSVKPDGSLEKKSTTSTLAGPVSSVRYKNGSAIALAHYGPAAVSTFALQSDDTYLPIQNITFNLSGSDLERQKTSHIHQAVLDPTGQYLLFPDLGGNLVHVYCVDPNTGMLVEHAPLVAKLKYGPRHAVFWAPNDKPTTAFLSVVHELANRITTYAVTYMPGGGLTFKETDDISTYPKDVPVSKDAAAAEITKTPDNKFIIVSNRLNPTFDIPSPGAGNQTRIKSDSLATFRLTENGTLSFVELHASGGLHPRHFSLNRDGSLVAVANQLSRSVVIWRRDTETGKFGEKEVAAAFGLGPGEVTNVQWLA